MNLKSFVFRGSEVSSMLEQEASAIYESLFGVMSGADILPIYGNISQENLHYVYVYLSTLAFNPGTFLSNEDGTIRTDRVYLPIVSDGGDIEFTLGLLGLMETAKANGIELITIATGTVASAATLIYLSGSERWATSQSNLMFHEGYMSASGWHSQIDSFGTRMNRLEGNMLDIISKYSSIPRAMVKETLLSHKDLDLPIEKLIEYGMCDRVVGHLGGVNDEGPIVDLEEEQKTVEVDTEEEDNEITGSDSD